MLEALPGLGKAVGESKGGAAHEGEPRMQHDGVLGEVAVGLDEAIDALVRPEPQSAGVGQDPGNQAETVRGRGAWRTPSRRAALAQRRWTER